MAKAKNAKPVVQVPVVSNLFGTAVDKAAKKPKKEPGTVIQLPVQLDSDGQITEEYAKLHNAVREVIEAKQEKDAATNRFERASKGVLREYVEGAYAERMAKSGALPTTPIVVVSHDGLDLTYVVQDKTTSVGLSEEQLLVLRGLLGDDKVSEITVEARNFAFDSETMLEIAGEIPVGKSAEEVAALPRVSDVVARRVSMAMAEAVNEGEITQEQLESLIVADRKVRLREGEFAKIATHTGADVNRIRGVLDALKGAVVRYFKA